MFLRICQRRVPSGSARTKKQPRWKWTNLRRGLHAKRLRIKKRSRLVERSHILAKKSREEIKERKRPHRPKKSRISMRWWIAKSKGFLRRGSCEEIKACIETKDCGEVKNWFLHRVYRDQIKDCEGHGSRSDQRFSWRGPHKDQRSRRDQDLQGDEVLRKDKECEGI